MKKRIYIISLILTAAMLLLLGACGGQTTQPSNVPNSSAPTQSAGSDGDEVYNLVLTTHDASTTTKADTLNAWAAELEEKSGGRLHIDLYYGGTIASAADSMDVVGQGGADMCWTTVPLNGSKFKYCNVFACYGEEITNTMQATYALVKLAQENADIVAEYENHNLKLIAIHAMTPCNIGSATTKFEMIDDFKGASVMAISKTNIAILEGLGAAPMGIVVSDLYENFSKHVSETFLGDALLYQSTNSYEHIKYMNEYNFSTCIGFLAMNMDKYNALPADLQELLDGEFESLSFAFAQNVNDGYLEFVDLMDERGVEIYELSPELLDKVEELIQTEVHDVWVADCEADGVATAPISDAIEKYLDEGYEIYGAEYDWYK